MTDLLFGRGSKWQLHFGGELFAPGGNYYRLCFTSIEIVAIAHDKYRVYKNRVIFSFQVW